jgi:methyl-accepting chemotaxis protein
MTPTLPHAAGGFSLRNVRTRPLLIGAFLLTCAIMVIVGGIGIWGMSQLADRTNQIANRSLPGVKALANTRGALFQAGLDFRQAVLDPNAATIQADIQRVVADEEQFKTAFASYQALTHSAGQQAFTTFQDAANTWLATLHTLETLGTQDTAASNLQVIHILRTQFAPQSDAMKADLNALIAQEQQQSDGVRADATATFTRLLWILGIILAVAIAGAVVLGYAIANQFAKPLTELSAIAQRVADGEQFTITETVARYGGQSEVGQLTLAFQQFLTNLGELVTSTNHLAEGELIPIDAIEARYAEDSRKGILAKALNRIIHRQMEYAEVAQRVGDGDLARIDHMLARYEGKPNAGIMVKAMNVMIENLRELVSHITEISAGVASTSSQIVEAADQSGHATEQVAQTIQQVASGALSQSAQLAQAATEIEQMTVQSKTLQAESLETMQAMEALKGSVSLTAERIRRLGQRSHEIGQIIQTIDEIARQTNLLALNAAIEAARAGEQGRGFAVVADEVRKLAERSADATREIEAIIHETQSETALAVEAMEHGVVQVEEGVARATRTEEQAQVMVRHSAGISHVISNVASVGEENGAAAEEVSAATEEMAAQVEETVASTQMLSSLANELRDAVSVFQLHCETEDSRAKPAHPAQPVDAQGEQKRAA